MKISVTPQQLGAWIARIGSVALVALGAIPADGVPASWHNALVIAGAVILAVDRYVTDPSTGTPTPPMPSEAPQRPSQPPQAPPVA